MVIVALGVFHGARRLYSSHMLFAESLHGDSGYVSRLLLILDNGTLKYDIR